MTQYRETQQSIAAWADETFGHARSNMAIAVRANEEMAELLRALIVDDWHPMAIEEVADVFIVLYRLAEMYGDDIHEAIDRKMLINRQREWRVDSTGHGYHVREKQ